MSHDTKKRIRVLFIVSTLARQGPTYQLYNQLKYMDTDKFDRCVLTLSPEPEDSLLPRFRQLGVACYSLGLSRLAGVFLALSRLKQFLRAHPTDVVHSSGLRAELLSAWALRGMPRVITRHPAFYESVLDEHNPIIGHAIERLHISGLGRVEHIVCVSDHVRRNAPEQLQSRITMIHNGVDTQTFCRVSTQKRRWLRNKLSLSQEAKILVTVGHLSPGKDPVAVLRGYLNSGLSRCSVLLMLGDGCLRRQCEKLSTDHSNVRIVGRISNVVEYLQVADVFVSGSLSEGCPMAVIEALACGLPVVLSDIEAHREILAFAPQAGILFPVKDVLRLGKCIQVIMNDGYASRSEAALNIVRNHFNARKMSAQYQALYTRSLEEYNHSEVK